MDLVALAIRQRRLVGFYEVDKAAIRVAVKMRLWDWGMATERDGDDLVATGLAKGREDR